MNLLSYYLLRIDEKTLRFVKSALKPNSNLTNLYFNKIRSLRENDLEYEAEKSAEKRLSRDRDNINLFINTLAGALALSA